MAACFKCMSQLRKQKSIISSVLRHDKLNSYVKGLQTTNKLGCQYRTKLLFAAGSFLLLSSTDPRTALPGTFRFSVYVHRNRYSHKKLEEERLLCYTTCPIFLWNTLRSTGLYVLYHVKLNGYAQGWTTYLLSSLTFIDFFFFRREKPVSKLMSYDFTLSLKALECRIYIYFLVSVLQMLKVLSTVILLKMCTVFVWLGW